MLKTLKVFDNTFSGKPVDIATCNTVTVSKYGRHPELLHAMYMWTIVADRKMYNMLAKLAKEAMVIQPPSTDCLTIYRGFNPDTFQDNLNIEGVPSVGDKGKYCTSERMMSATTDFEVASNFGDIVIKATINPNKDVCLIATDELMYAVMKHGGATEIVTQSEVILMPPISIEWEVVKA